MSQNKTVKKISYFLVLVGISSAIMLVFNNCSKGRSAYLESAFEPIHKLQDEMILNTRGLIDQSDCENSQQYICTQKIFSQKGVYSKSKIKFDCVGDLCVEGERFTYDSSVAAKLCTEHCTEVFDFEEVTCNYNLANENGSYPLQSTADNIAQALTETYHLCLRAAHVE